MEPDLEPHDSSRARAQSGSRDTRVAQSMNKNHLRPLCLGAVGGTQKRGAGWQEHPGYSPSAGGRHCEGSTEARRVFAEIPQAVGGSSRGRWALSYSPSKALSQLKLHFPFFV